MRITNEYIKSLNPCFDRHENYLQYYKDTDLSVVEFLQLEHITYDDKIWVWRHFTTKDEAILFALKCADSVLYIFETRYSDDNRPRLALDAVREYMKDSSLENRNKCDAASIEAYAAVYAADAAACAAYACAYAAACAHDAYAAAYAATAVYAHAVYDDYAPSFAASAYDAAYAAAYAAVHAVYAVYIPAAARKAQQDKNIQFLIEIYEGR